MDSKVEEFKAITGAPSELARSLLEACGGNLELALNMHMEGESPGVPPPQGHSSGSAMEQESSSDTISSPTSYEAIHGVRAPIPQTSGVLIEEETPPRVIRRSRRRLPQTVFDPFQDFQNTGRFGRSPTASKKKSLAQLFKPPHDIMFHGTFHEAKLNGQRCKKWLLVNLQDSKEFPSQVLNRDVWSNHNVKDIIRQNFVFWQVYCITDEGIKFKQLYDVSGCPFIAIIDPMTGEKMADWGSLTVSAFTDSALEFLSTHQYTSSLPSGSQAHQHLESVADKSEESQLEAAIQASLKEAEMSKKKQQVLVFSDDSDIDCISLNSSDEEEKSLDVEDVEFMGKSSGGTSTHTRLLDVEYRGMCNGSISNGGRKRPSWVRDDELSDEELPRKMMRADISESVEERDGVSEPGTGSSDADVYLFLFRLPDGSRVQHKFINTHPIKELFAFLEAKGIRKTEHEIITQFPRRNLCSVDPMATLLDLGLHRRETIFIHTTD